MKEVNFANKNYTIQSQLLSLWTLLNIIKWFHFSYEAIYKLMPILFALMNNAKKQSKP